MGSSASVHLHRFKLVTIQRYRQLLIEQEMLEIRGKPKIFHSCRLKDTSSARRNLHC